MLTERLTSVGADWPIRTRRRNWNDKTIIEWHKYDRSPYEDQSKQLASKECMDSGDCQLTGKVGVVGTGTGSEHSEWAV